MKPKKCKICNDWFVPEHSAQQICKRVHYAACPICNKQVVWNSTKKVSPCCTKCSNEQRQRSVRGKLNVNNVMNSSIVVNKRSANWKNKVTHLLPLRMEPVEECPKFIIDESNMQVFILTEDASIQFLNKYGFRIDQTPGRIHLSVGLVQDGILYQVLRFERKYKSNLIQLVDFGTRAGYYNPNGYAKLTNFITEIRGIDSFIAEIPERNASEEIIKSLSLKKVKKGFYQVYWKIVDDTGRTTLKKLTRKDNIEQMLQKYDYVTSDYIDVYEYYQSL